MAIQRTLYYRQNTAKTRLCLSTQKKGSGVPPSLIFISEKPLFETDEITIFICSGRKVKTHITDCWKKIRSMDPGYEKDEIKEMSLEVNILYGISHYPLDNESIIAMEEHPEFFKKVVLTGRTNIFHYITTNLKLDLIWFNKFFGESPDDETHEENENVVKFHNATVFFPTTMRETRKKACLDFLEIAYDDLTKASLQKVFSGSIRFIPLNPKLAGEYDAQSKDIRIQPNVKFSNRVVFTIIHEFGHKFYFEFLREEQKTAITDQFNHLVKSGKRLVSSIGFEKNNKENVLLKLDVGDTIQYIGSKRAFKGSYEVVASGLQVKIKDENGHVLSGPASAFTKHNFKKATETESSTDLIGKYDQISETWFPTPYSMTDAEEWFAENFAFYVLGHIKNEEVRKWFSKIIW